MMNREIGTFHKNLNIIYLLSQNTVILSTFQDISVSVVNMEKKKKISS